MITPRTGDCTECGSEGVHIHKRISERKYCFYCNKKRLQHRKEEREPLKESGQIEMFHEIWKEREHKSFVTGLPLDKYFGTKKWIWCFEHILNKGYYIKAKLDKDCVVLLTPEEHYLVTHGDMEQRLKYKEACIGGCDWIKYYELKEQLKQKYNKV